MKNLLIKSFNFEFLGWPEYVQSFLASYVLIQIIDRMIWTWNFCHIWDELTYHIGFNINSYTDNSIELTNKIATFLKKDYKA